MMFACAVLDENLRRYPECQPALEEEEEAAGEVRSGTLSSMGPWVGRRGK